MITVIAPTTGTANGVFDSSNHHGCAVLFSAGPLVSAEQVEIKVTGTAGNVALFQDGVQVVLSATNPTQQCSSGPTYVLVKGVTATACSVDACPIGK